MFKFFYVNSHHLSVAHAGRPHARLNRGGVRHPYFLFFSFFSFFCLFVAFSVVSRFLPSFSSRCNLAIDRRSCLFEGLSASSPSLFRISRQIGGGDVTTKRWGINQVARWEMTETGLCPLPGKKNTKTRKREKVASTRTAQSIARKST